MRKILVTVALGAAAVSAPILAQGGFMQRDMTRDQAKQMADLMFQRLDANRDGIVTKAEADQAAAQLGGGENGRGAGRIQRMIQRAFTASDSVTQAQFEAQALARFDAQDLNHDGTVTAAERQQRREQRGQAPAPAPVQPPPQ
jgi:hypothetical protein